MHCDKCGFDNPAGMRFCGQCATPLNQPCPSCGFVNPFDFEYCGQCATRLRDTPKSTAAAHTDPQRNQQQAERRQLTVLFCDMVGSSALSERIDPEELRDILRDYRATCREIVESYGGYIAQYLGDGILVYFGFPHAHEDDARRAAHAALEITQRIPQHHYRHQDEEIRLAVRVGVHTGLVVVGEIGGGDKRSLALGETPNIAARIQDHAASDTVVISQVTRELIGEKFVCSTLGNHLLKGFSQALELFHLVSKQQHPGSRFPTRHPGQAALVGREQESELILERLGQAQKGVGQIVLLGGEPGLGKTRMVQMVCEEQATAPCFLLECSGAPYYRNSFLHPVIEMIRQLMALNEANDDRQRLRQLEKGIAALGMEVATVVPILAELLSIPSNSQGDTTTVSTPSTPQQKKQQIIDTLLAIVRNMAQQRFILLIVEDLQWIDASTLELISAFIKQPGLGNIFALFTFRSEFTPPWKPHANLTWVTLNRLTRQQSGSMIRHLCQGKTLPLEVFSDIVNKTDGIPLYIEELTNTVLRSRILIEKDDHFELSKPLSQVGIPTTLQDSLMARLDNLGQDKELAQLSATLGREFGHELLSAACSQNETTLQQSLNRLINAELFFQRGQPPKAQYRFRHALLREAAYHSLLKRTRQQYHQQIATLIKEQFPDICSENPEILAHHCTEAGNHDEALQYWLAAGRYAVQRSANLEAIAHLQRGLDSIEQMADNPQRRMHELALQTTLGLAVIMSKGFAATQVKLAYERAHDLCQDIADTPSVFPILNGLWEFHIVRADLARAEEISHELQRLAQQFRTSEFRLEAQRALGTTYFWQGKLSAAIDLLEIKSDELNDDILPYSSLVSYSQDTRVAAFSNYGCVLWLLGYPDQAIQQAEQSLSLAKRLAHPFSQAYALHFLGTLSQLCGDREKTLHYADAQIALSGTYGFPFWVATGKMLKAWAQADTQPAELCCSNFSAALEEYKHSGNRLAHSYFHALLAELYLQDQQLDKAEDIVEQALQEVGISGEEFFSAELLRIRAEIELARTIPNIKEALAYFEQGRKQAAAQESRSLLLRLLTGLTRMQYAPTTASHCQQHMAAINPHAGLQTCIGQFKQGHETADLATAREILAHANQAITSPVDTTSPNR